jgi:hypothetical protein
MSELRHCVVALDDVGNTIQHMAIRAQRHGGRTAYRDRLIWTTDWGEATKRSGRLTDALWSYPGGCRLHPHNRHNEPAVMVAGYEVISETVE